MRAQLVSTFVVSVLASSFALGCSSGSGGGGTEPGTDSDVVVDTAGGDANVEDNGSNPPDVVPADSGDAPPGSGCTVTAKGTAGVSIKGRILGESGPINGEILVSALDGKGTLLCVDADCSANAAYAAATHLDCHDSIVSPGLINAHEHLDYNVAAPIVSGTKRYQERQGWRTGGDPAGDGTTKLAGQPKSTSDANVLAASELRHLLGGTTSVVGSGGNAGLVRDVASATAAFTEGLSGKTARFDTFPLGDTAGKEVTSGCAYPKIITPSAAFAFGNYIPHISEGISLASENEFHCLDVDPNNVISGHTAVIHAVALNAKDIDVLAKAKAMVVWSPRSNMDLYGNTASVTTMKKMGVQIALGTDWLASGSMSILRELACADSLSLKYFPGVFTDQELWQMVTINAAKASGFDNQIGSLKTGLVADVVVFSPHGKTDYRAIIEGSPEDVLLVLRGGKPLHGDATLIDALAPTGCEALDVCGQAKKVCLDDPGVTLASVKTAAAFYPLFACRGTAPKDEPTCVPYRDTYPAGISTTDRDGDGIDDAKDICPDIFNPIRLMDGAAQADSDSDGAGDACDGAPLDPATK